MYLDQFWIKLLSSCYQFAIKRRRICSTNTFILQSLREVLVNIPFYSHYILHEEPWVLIHYHHVGIFTRITPLLYILTISRSFGLLSVFFLYFYARFCRLIAVFMPSFWVYFMLCFSRSLKASF